MKMTRILELLLQVAPPSIVAYLNYPIFTENTGKSLTTAGILIVIILLFGFRDQLKKQIQSPSVFKVSLVLFFIGYVAIQFGEQLFLISAAGLIGSVASMPLTYLRNSDKEDEFIATIKGLVSNNEIKR